MNTIFSTIRNIFNYVTRRHDEPSDVITEAPCTISRKRPQNENFPEVEAKRRKPNPTSHLGGDFDNASSLPMAQSMHRGLTSRDRTIERKPACAINFTKPLSHSTPNPQNIYCIDEEDLLLKRKRILQGSEYASIKQAENWKRLNGNNQGLSPSSFMGFPSAMCQRSQLCLNRVHKEQEAATFLEIVKKYAPPSALSKKSLPLTTSSMHNTNQNCTFNRSYFSYQMALPLAENLSSLKRIDFRSGTKPTDTVIDLTADEDDESQRQAIEASVLSSPEIKNFKSSFIAKNCPLADPDYLVDLTRKYEKKRQNIGSRIQQLQKTIRDNNEEFCKTLAEVLERRLTIKDATEPEVEGMPSWEIAPITQSMIAELEKILKSCKIPLVKIKNEEVKLQDIRTLDNFAWLNDAVINSYMNLIQLRAENNLGIYPEVYCFNTFLYPTLRSRGYSSVRRWTRRVDIFSYPIIIIPIHQGGNHWCLVQIRMNEQRILYYDSLGSANTICLESIMQYLLDEHKDKKSAPLNKDDWTLINVPSDEIPKQMNAYDCGVFACTYAEHITRNSPFNFDQDHMQYFRLKMKYEILTGSLLL